MRISSKIRTASPWCPRYERRGIRRRVHGNYVIFYRVETAKVVIVHILHGAIDYGAILFGDEFRPV